MSWACEKSGDQEATEQVGGTDMGLSIAQQLSCSSHTHALMDTTLADVWMVCVTDVPDGALQLSDDDTVDNVISIADSCTARFAVKRSCINCPDLWQSTFSEDHSAHSSVAQL